VGDKNLNLNPNLSIYYSDRVGGFDARLHPDWLGEAVAVVAATATAGGGGGDAAAVVVLVGGMTMDWGAMV
jgi:hypothetical protein